MAKIDLDSLNIEELAALRERTIEKLAEKVASRQVELEAEMERLSQYGKPSKKAQAAPVAKAKKSDEKKGDETSDEAREPKDPIADAAEAA
jgi:alkylated DNA repair dioxygenase AlkB